MKKLSVIFILIFLICFIFPVPSMAASDKKCLTCHIDPETKDHQGNPVNIDLDVFEKSVHGRIGLECVACHTDVADMAQPSHNMVLKKVDCQNCHETIWGEYSKSVHGVAYLSGDTSAAICVKCHGTHNIMSPKDPDSPVAHENITDLCLKCHINEEILKEHDLNPEKIKAYMDSVHYKGLKEKGLPFSATCTDCHGVHTIKKISKTEKTFEVKIEMVNKCVTCHKGLYNTYAGSIHGKAILEKKNIDAPICTDCHGEHTIKSHLARDSSTYATHISETCSHCHDNELINSKYELPGLRLKTYKESYHGVATSLGDVTVANCASCHGYHSVLPSSDPASSVNIKNIGKTCGTCHPASEKLFTGEINIHKPAELHALPHAMKSYYPYFILSVMSSFVIYILADIYGHFRRKRLKKKAAV